MRTRSTAALSCLAALAMLAAGCCGFRAAGPQAGSPQIASTTRAPAPRLAAAEDADDEASLDPAQPSSPSSASAPALREPSPRPGLGTTFGETRVSRVRDVAFERAEERPSSVATVYYNDRAGVDAMARHDVRRAALVDVPVAMRGGLTASLVDESGQPLEALSVGGRVYVIGEVGRRYTLVVRNMTGQRFEIVASVDGLDVVDGETASFDKRGYVIGPFGTVTIDGFRRSHDEVAAFRFGAVGASYAARTTGDRNVGVIGLAFFAERGGAPFAGFAAPPPVDDEEVERRQSAQPFSDARFARPPR